MWADPAKCHGHKNLSSLIRRECPEGKVARRRPCPVERKTYREEEWKIVKRRDNFERMWRKGRRMIGWESSRGKQQHHSACPIFQVDGRGPALFMVALNMLKLALVSLPSVSQTGAMGLFMPRPRCLITQPP